MLQYILIYRIVAIDLTAAGTICSTDIPQSFKIIESSALITSDHCEHRTATVLAEHWGTKCSSHTQHPPLPSPPWTPDTGGRGEWVKDVV